ncbi:MAG: acetate--CoA ligase family protein, partial [Thermoplasmata archaeon]|nr:acetate--CoA ligase family protein [Thermoplasmata archaeon]
PRLAILTNSGGPGIVAADACARQGLELPPPPAPLVEKLTHLLSPSSAFGNPVDMTADAGAKQYREALAGLLASPEYNGAIVISTPTGTLAGRAATQAILDGRGDSRKPVTACLFGLTDLSEDVMFLEEHGIPTFSFPEEAVGGLASVARFHAWKARPRTEVRSFPVDRAAVSRLIEQAQRDRQSVLPEYAARGLLSAFGIPTVAARRVHSVAQAKEAAGSLGYPVALKVASPDISHKTDVGGVALGLSGAEELERAWNAMAGSIGRKAPNARIEGFEVETMIPEGHEVLVGVQRDSGFGPVVVFGMGGIYVEVLKDVTFRLAPLRPLSAEHMVAAVRASPILRGVRGEPPSDLAALYEVIERVSQLAVEVPELQELDINPLIVRAQGHGAVAVDARVVLAPSSRSAPSA